MPIQAKAHRFVAGATLFPAAAGWLLGGATLGNGNLAADSPGLASDRSPAGTKSARADADRLTAQMRQAIDTGDWRGAIELGKRVVDLLPGEPAPPYNLACIYARSGDVDAAVRWMQTAADRGFSYVATFLRDEDLDAIRRHASYPAILARLRQNGAEALERFKPQAEKAVVITVAPPKLDRSKAAPLIVALHGRGGTAQSMVNVWRGVAAELGAVLVAPQAMMPLGDNGFDWGVVDQGEYLVLRAIEKARADFNIDSKRIVVTGFSQGGAMTFTLSLRHRELFAGAIPVSGGYDHPVDPIPDKPTHLPRFVIINGMLDEGVDNNRDAAARLEAIGAKVQLKLYDGVGHAFPQNRDAELKKAMGFVLGTD